MKRVVILAILAAIVLAAALAASAAGTPVPPAQDEAADADLLTAIEDARAFRGSNASWQAQYPDGLQHTFDDGAAMVLVPAGCFTMGSYDFFSDEQPVTDECFDAPFWIDQTEVTQADFERLGGVQAEPSYSAGPGRPVENITWLEARDFCVLRGARLPTEREWEYAARGPDTFVNGPWDMVFPWGEEWDEANAVWNRTVEDGTADVGSLPAGRSWVGAFDLSGNVWEWVHSPYLPYDSEADAEEGAELLQFVMRGGSWWDMDPTFLRTSVRSSGDPGYWNYNIGFRCARDT